MMMKVISYWQFVITAGSDGHKSAGRTGTVYVTACLVTANCRQLWQVHQYLLQSRCYGTYSPAVFVGFNFLFQQIVARILISRSRSVFKEIISCVCSWCSNSRQFIVYFRTLYCSVSAVPIAEISSGS